MNADTGTDESAENEPVEEGSNEAESTEADPDEVGGNDGEPDQIESDHGNGLSGRSTPAFLSTIRERRRWRATALVVAVVVGLGFAWVHWLGLFVAGALVGLVSRTLPRALLGGLAVGGVILVVQVVASPGMDAMSFIGFAPPSYVAIAAAIAAPVWGSLVRGVA